jgi:branched-chain amino acid transport system permease protein
LRDKRLVYLLLMVLGCIAPLILRTNYLRELLVLTGIFILMAESMNVVMGYMGLYSFGHAAFFGTGAYASALLSLRLGVSPWLGFLAAIVLAAAFGAFVGFLCLRRTRGIYLAIVTFAFGVVMWLIAMQWSSLTGGNEGIPGVPSPVITIPFLYKFEFRSELSYYYLILALLAFTLYFLSRLLCSRFGRALLCARDNEDLAKAIGINPFKYYVAAFTLAAAAAGLAGAAYGHHLGFVNPMLLGLDYTFAMLISVIVGGIGTLAGPVIGAVIYIWVSELLHATMEFRLMIFGAILLLAILFMPNGVYPFLITFWNRLVIKRLSERRNR